MKTIKCKHVFKKYPKLEESWNRVYKNRKKKVGSKKAVYSADAVVMAEALKLFTKRKPHKIKIESKKENNYEPYFYRGLAVYISDDKDFQKKFPESKNINKIEDDFFEMQVILETTRRKKIKINNKFYYYIEENEVCAP